MDRLVAAMPEWERMPPPASGVEAELTALALRHAAESAEYRMRMDAKMDSIRSMERTVWVLAVALLAGTAAAVVAEVLSAPPPTAEFLREKP
jgi:hypothetical protein